MPQINRIRVNNVKYNFGTQYYDDFFMRFSCRNTIYDLANGGGKSVLMLLLLQNMIPNCTLDDKQPIEKLFRPGCDNTTIHSLIEWKLDAGCVKNGMKYMTTGFCARKAKEASDSAERKNETANIEYFNYCIFYKEFGDNDIKNLPLSKGNERITYNGLKSYLRDLEKKDYGVEVRIFERKGDYQNFISEYGLHESQWEIIRGINKTEGHVRTYFETNYKTTRKVIEDLLIEGIIEKSYNNRIRKGNEDDSQMAKTLFDMKEKLTELSKRKTDIDKYDEQIRLINVFTDKLGEYKKIFEEKKKTEDELVKCLRVCRMRLAGEKAKTEELGNRKDELAAHINEIKRRTAIAEIETETIELEQLEKLIAETAAEKETLLSSYDRLKENLRYGKAASDYFDYVENKARYDELKELISNSTWNREDVLKELSQLAAFKKTIVDGKISKLEAQINEIKALTEKISADRDEAADKKLDVYGEINKNQGQLKQLKNELEELNKNTDELMLRCNLTSNAGIEDIISKAEDMLKSSDKALSDYTSRISEEEDNISDLNREYLKTETEISFMKNEEDRAAKLYEKEQQLLTDLNQIKNVYGENDIEQLIEKIEKVLAEITENIVEAKSRIKYLGNYEKAINENKLPEYDRCYEEVLSYLKSRYDDVKSGAEYIASMEDNERSDYIAENPMLPYMIFAGDSYEEIKHDEMLYSLSTGSYIIPIVKTDNILRADKENMVGACHDLSFIFNGIGSNSELVKISEDIEKEKDNLARLNDKYDVISKDLYFCRYAENELNANLSYGAPEDIKEEKERLTSYLNRISEDMEMSKKRLDGYKTSFEREQAHNGEVADNLLLYKKIKENTDRLASLYEDVRTCEKLIGELTKEHGDMSRKVRSCDAVLTEKENIRKSFEEEADEIGKEYKEKFEPYFNGEAKEPDIEEDEINIRAGALRKIISDEMGELADKEKQLARYDELIKKNIDNLKYYGFTVAEAKKAKEEGLFSKASVDERLVIKNQLDKIKSEIDKTDGIINSEQAQKNRIEGSIWHGKKLYEEQYGEFVREKFNDPQAYIVTGRQEISAITAGIQNIEKELKKIDDSNRDLLVMERDIERIFRAVGIYIPEDGLTDENIATDDDIIGNYEEVEKKYDRLRRDEQRKKNTFLNDKQKLSDDLYGLEAYDLAAEIKLSLNAPESAEDVEDMVKGLKETADYIALERDNVEQGIRDLQQIADNFEERCIQICSNIRTELERLPKLSKINLDGESVPVITLQIPYIKEEFYKEKMTTYINDTIARADTFDTQDDKLKYIKNQLSWKKLFSVIVSDMNSIRLCLYKREHMKDRSRYLKYEEAVGSTGQSQGIYIQFLIAVIHYISSINSSFDMGISGNTIFIDNPFGAAKDIYIWEPIFKLLKTNHVQLIVPVRGATPAITRMFDVNYILGQKMVGDRQQTVVVDYRSQVNTEDSDYNVTEFTQTTLKLD